MDAGVGPLINQQKLQHDLGYLIKRIKQREEQHRKFFEYNNKINSRWNQIADEIFIHDQLSKLRNYIQEKLSIQQSQQTLDQQICSRYDNIYSCPDSVVLLMKRVAIRVVQVAQMGFESLKEPIEYYSLMFNRFKTACLRASSDAISCRPCNLIKIFSRFLHHKIQVEAERLREIANFLELSDSKSLQGLKQAYYRRLYTKQLANKQHTSRQSVDRSESISLASVKIIKKGGGSMHSQKQIRIKLSKHDQKQRQRMRKLQIKKMKKYVHSLCEVMDVNKEQMLEDIFIGNKQSQSRRIYTQLSGRNKHNLSQILTFLEKAPQPKEITPAQQREEVRQVKKLQTQLMFERRSSPSKKLDDSNNIVIKISKVSPTKNQRQANNRYTRRQSFNTKSRNIYKRQKNNVNNGEDQQNQKQKEICQTEKQIAGEFIQINIKNQEQKQRFPQIYTRATSVDTVKIMKKQAQLKYFKEQKLLREQNNRQIARGSLESSNQTFGSKKNIIDNAEVVSNSNIDKYRGRQKIETKIKLELKTMGSNFFDQIGKRISKFCEMKKNLVA